MCEKLRLNTTSSFGLGARQTRHAAKVNGANIHLPFREYCNFSTFKRWPTCARQALRLAKNRVSILLPVSARERAKPDIAKVNGNFNVKNNHLPVKELFNYTRC